MVSQWLPLIHHERCCQEKDHQSPRHAVLEETPQPRGQGRCTASATHFCCLLIWPCLGKPLNTYMMKFKEIISEWTKLSPICGLFFSTPGLSLSQEMFDHVLVFRTLGRRHTWCRWLSHPMPLLRKNVLSLCGPSVSFYKISPNHLCVRTAKTVLVHKS